MAPAGTPREVIDRAERGDRERRWPSPELQSRSPEARRARLAHRARPNCKASSHPNSARGAMRYAHPARRSNVDAEDDASAMQTCPIFRRRHHALADAARPPAPRGLRQGHDRRLRPGARQLPSRIRHQAGRQGVDADRPAARPARRQRRAGLVQMRAARRSPPIWASRPATSPCPRRSARWSRKRPSSSRPGSPPSSTRSARTSAASRGQRWVKITFFRNIDLWNTPQARFPVEIVGELIRATQRLYPDNGPFEMRITDPRGTDFRIPFTDDMRQRMKKDNRWRGRNYADEDGCYVHYIATHGPNIYDPFMFGNDPDFKVGLSRTHPRAMGRRLRQAVRQPARGRSSRTTTSSP